MSIREKILYLKNSAISSILKRLEKTKQLPEPPRNLDSYNFGKLVDISLLSSEEREKAFMEFSEGDDGLYTLLTTAYEHGIESMFSCSGHFNNFGYVVFKVNDDNLKSLQQLGKVLSHEGIATNFEQHHKLGFRVLFHSHHATSKDWFYKAAETIENMPNFEITPTILYHETVYPSYQPFLSRIKQGIIEKLRKWSEELVDVENPRKIQEDIKTVSQKLREDFSTIDSKKTIDIKKELKPSDKHNINSNTQGQ